LGRGTRKRKGSEKKKIFLRRQTNDRGEGKVNRKKRVKGGNDKKEAGKVKTKRGKGDMKKRNKNYKYKIREKVK
jgi:hypothetical protein